MSDPADLLEEAVPHEEQEQVTHKLIGEIVEAIDDRDAARVRELFEDLHPADAADAVEQLVYDQQVELAEIAPEVFGGEMLAELQEDTRADIVNELDPSHLAEAIQDLDSDDMTLVVEDLSPEMREQVLAEVPAADRTRLESSLSFEEDTAGRLMQREFVAAPTFWSVGNTIDHMRKAGEDLPDLFFEVFVVDEGFKPIGSVPVSKLMRFPRDTKLADIMETPHAIIRPDRDQEEVAYLFEKYHLISAPVVDDDGRLSGMLTIDDIVDVIQEENKEDMLALAGVNEASSADTVWSSVKARAPWLLVNLGTAVLASGVIALFEGAIAQLVALAVLMPIVASMGGNAGTQSLAVAVRAIASRDLTVSNAARVIWREFAAGALNGVIFAVVMGAVAGLWFQNVTLAWVIGLAMIINLACAGLAGILIPLGLKRAGADPAVASSVFVTTVTDVVGFFVFLGLGAMVLL
ncbi:magnesium transporter [Marinicauda algicola]|uniref:Magnesium transporter MgtE n=1 Tax=Marinicauda algicola TaxID=2029849 RepID=A0A4S2H283_9PROT|nr:magnesium transporter [Marinicauda algicola]TGY89697.1 magnesium transporter [Marinicauda algicola]